MYDESIGLLPTGNGGPCPILSLLLVSLSSTITIGQCLIAFTTRSRKGFVFNYNWRSDYSQINSRPY
jgi:hypothetical protein